MVVSVRSWPARPHAEPEGRHRCSDIARAITEAKAGKIEYRLDKTNIIHCPIGKISFGTEKLTENFNTLLEAINKAKPAAAKGQYIRSCVVAATMGPGVKINPNKVG